MLIEWMLLLDDLLGIILPAARGDMGSLVALAATNLAPFAKGAADIEL